jgi:hypothetical protein
MSQSSRWRFALAQELGRSYASNPKARVILVAGSTGRGRADRYSDLEIEVYWSSPPSLQEREIAAQGSGGTLITAYDYEDEEWAEDISFGGFQVGTSTYLVETMERSLEEVLTGYSTAPLPQMRLFSLLHAAPLLGTDLVNRWRERAACYPDGLVFAMLHENLSFDGFGYAEDMLAARDDVLALYTIFCAIERQAFGALLGLNRIYLPNPNCKSMREYMEEMRLVPVNFAERCQQAFRLPLPQGVQLLHELIEELFTLVESSFPGFDIAPYRSRMSQRRGIWDQAPGH